MEFRGHATPTLQMVSRYGKPGEDDAADRINAEFPPSRSDSGNTRSVKMSYPVRMPGKDYNALMDVAVDQYGYVTAEDAAAVGVVADRLRKMAERGTLERIAYGLYRVPAVAATGLDQYMEATLWPRGGGVLCHDTALDLHELCDINPAKIHVTVRKDLRITRAIPALYRLHHRDLDEREITRHEGIPIVTPARAIRDGIEAHLGAHLIKQAIMTARERGAITKAEEAELKRLALPDRQAA